MFNFIYVNFAQRLFQALKNAITICFLLVLLANPYSLCCRTAYSSQKDTFDFEISFAGYKRIGDVSVNMRDETAHNKTAAVFGFQI